MVSTISKQVVTRVRFPPRPPFLLTILTPGWQISFARANFKKWGQGPLSRYLGLPHPSPAARIAQDLGISDSNLLGHRSPAAGTGRGQLVATRELTPYPRVFRDPANGFRLMYYVCR